MIKYPLENLLIQNLMKMWKEYMPDVDSKISCSKSRYENDISTSGYVKENDGLGTLHIIF